MEKKDIYIAIAVLIIIIIITLFVGIRLEFFETVDEKGKKIIDIEQDRLVIPPLVTEEDKGLIMSGYDFEGMPEYIYPAWGSDPVSTKNIKEHSYCSKSCCSPQYPVGFDVGKDGPITGNNKYLQSNLSCHNDWQDTGCLCMTNEMGKLWADRGGNTYNVIKVDTSAEQQVFNGRSGNSVILDTKI